MGVVLCAWRVIRTGAAAVAWLMVVCLPACPLLPACLSSSLPPSLGVCFVFAGLFFVSFGRLKTNSEELLPNSLEETLRVMADDGRVNVTATR